LDIKKLAVLTGVVALTLAGCAAGTESDAGETASTETAAVEAVAVSDIKICVYTHGDGGTFWSVAQAGAEKAGEDLGITVDYQGSTTTLHVRPQPSRALSPQVVRCSRFCSGPRCNRAGHAGLADAGIATVTMNSGSDVFKSWAFTHVGQDEIVAGREAGYVQRPGPPTSSAPFRKQRTLD